MSCGCMHALARLPAKGAAPETSGRIRIDFDALRVGLGGPGARVVRAMEASGAAKARGRPTANVGVLWNYLTKDTYKSGDLPLIATREALQNSRDAIGAAVRAHKTKAGAGRFEVEWDESTRTIAWTDNGIGMDADTILTKFLGLGESGKRGAASSEEAAGGFGVAKAVILGVSTSFTWRLQTRDNLAISTGMEDEVQIYDAPYFQGTRLAVSDVDPKFRQHYDYARRSWVNMDERLRELLGANDLPGIELLYDGEVVKPLFSRRGGTVVSVEGSWGEGTTGRVKAYRRPPGDKGGAYYIRLGGLFQFKTPSRKGGLKADVVIDLETTIRPGAPGYPFNAARDALKDQPSWTLQDLMDEVEQENESLTRDKEDEVFDPDSDDADEAAAGRELGELAGAAFEDPGFRKALAEAAGGIADFYGEQAKYDERLPPETIESSAPAGTRVDDDPEGQRHHPLPPGMNVANMAVLAPDIAAPQAAFSLTQLFHAADAAAKAESQADGGYRLAPIEIMTPELRGILVRIGDGFEPSSDEVGQISDAIDQVAAAALEPGGGGLLQAANVQAGGDHALRLIAPNVKAKPRNPFGKLAGLRISKKNYDRRRAGRFRKNYGKWLPFLAVWDATLRMMAAEAKIRRKFKPGFVLDDKVVGLTASTQGADSERRSPSVVYIHPDRFEQVVNAHKERPIAIAAFLHGLAAHELTHLDGRMDRGHNEEYVSAREDLGEATGHLLPAIAILAEKVLGLPPKITAEHKVIRKLERQLATALDKVKRAPKDNKAIAKLKGELADAKASITAAKAESDKIGRECCATCHRCRTGPSRAERVIDTAIRFLVGAPPAGLTQAEVIRITGKHRAALIETAIETLEAR